MKIILSLSLAALALAAAPVAHGFTYKDGDVLLVFRKDLNQNDVEFNLGNISQFLNRTNGQQVVVTNWDLQLVRSNFDLGDGLKVILLATTSPDSTNRLSWLTSAELNTTPADRTASQWQGLWSKINAVGGKPQDYTHTNAGSAFVGASTLPASYSYVASNAGSEPALLPKLGGGSTFIVEQTIPAELRFYQIAPSSAPAKPASRLIGTFTFGTNGVLTFTAGVVAPPQIAGSSRAGDVVTVTFPTLQGWKYRLRYSDDLVAPVNSWLFLDSSVAGNGSSRSLRDTNSGPRRFYSVERKP